VSYSPELSWLNLDDLESLFYKGHNFRLVSHVLLLQEGVATEMYQKMILILTIMTAIFIGHLCSQKNKELASSASEGLNILYHVGSFRYESAIVSLGQDCQLL